MCASYINLATSLPGIHFQNILSAWEGFTGKYHYVPSLIIAGALFTVLHRLPERFPSFSMAQSVRLQSRTNALADLTANSASTRQVTQPAPHIRSPKSGRFLSILMFARALLSNPRQLGAVAPSSHVLAGLITAEITPYTGPIIELGPGTGVFTRAILKRGVPEEELVLIECNANFVKRLGLQFARSRIFCLDASRLRNVELFQDERAGAVISGLPLLSMSRQKVMAILSASFSHMRDAAAFYQFTYGLRCPVPRTVLDRLDLRAKRIGFTYANLPPASVYRIRRRRSLYLERCSHTSDLKEHLESRATFSKARNDCERGKCNLQIEEDTTYG